jgi:hypothetical protein
MPFRTQELSNRDKKKKSDKEGQLEIDLKEKEDRQGEVWTLKKIATTMFQRSSLKSSERQV